MRPVNSLFLILFFIPALAHSQKQSLKQIEADLLATSNRLFSFYQPYQHDSLEKYSEELRIYSWDTWTGGSMRFYNNIFQYNYMGKVITEFDQLEEGDAGGFFSELFTLK